MKKLIISALAVALMGGSAFAQSKEELKAIKEQQKQISTLLKEAEKAAKLTEDAMGQIDQSKKPDFGTARKKIAEAFANPQSATMAGDINRVAANIENNVYRFTTKGATEGVQEDLNDYLLACGAGFQYFQAAWDEYQKPDEKGKVNAKYNDAMAATASNLFLASSGLYNCGLISYQNENFAEAAKYWEMASYAMDSPIIAHAKQKNPLLEANLLSLTGDSIKFLCRNYAASTYMKVNPEKAIEVYKSMIGENTDQFGVYAGIVTVYSEAKDTTNMITWLDKGMQAMPQDSRFSNQLFYIYLDRQDYEGAINSLKASLNNTPDNVSAIVLIARLYTQQGQFADAKPYYERALGLDANNLDANLYYGLNYLSEMEAGESELLKNHARDSEMDAFSNEKLDAALPLLRKAFAADVEHETSDIATLLMQVLYRKFSPSNAQNKAALINEYNEVAVAYGRPEYQK